MSTDKISAPRLAEFTLKSVLGGLLFGVVFGAANAYLGLRAGLTVSTSIPIAVLTAVVFRALRMRATILELNMAQTVGSASSSLASGTIFTIPALFMWGLEPSATQVAILACAGGMLGILAMIPLRRLLIVQAEAELPYPEGRACAEVLRAAGESASGGKWIVLGLLFGAVIKIAVTGLHLFPEDTKWLVGGFKNGEFALKIAPALVAVGYIVGFRAASVMIAGSLISSFVLLPILSEVSIDAAAAGAAAPTAGGLREKYITFIGAGAVAVAGLITVVRTAPTMVKSLAAVFRGLKSKSAAGAGQDPKDRDVPGWVLFAGLALVASVLAFFPGAFGGDMNLKGRMIAAAGVLLFGFIFVPVSSRLVGVIGVSSNPTSAMALITLVGTAGIFMAMGWNGDAAKAAILTVGTVVCVAASKAGDISQDLKTGQLVGATPMLQQFGQMIAACVACWAVAGVVIALGHGPDKYGSDALAAPQAKLMKTVIDSVVGGSMKWNLVLGGGALAGVGFLAGLPALPFALGIYLPLSTMSAIFVGGVVRKLSEVAWGKADSKSGIEKGILCASGFVAGEGLAGVVIAGWAFATNAGRYKAPAASPTEKLVALAVLAVACVVLFRASTAGKKTPATA